MYDFLNYIFGINLFVNELTLFHLTARAFLVYFTGMFLVRIQSQLMMVNTPFNYMLNFIMGSLLANAIVGEGAFFPIVGMCLFISLLSWFIEFLCYYSSFFEKIFKGKRDTLVKDGKIIWKNMRKNLITKDELLESVHGAQLQNISQIKRAYFEYSGHVTIIPK